MGHEGHQSECKRRLYDSGGQSKKNKSATVNMEGKSLNSYQNSNVYLKKTNENQYSISTDKTIQMRSYNVEPKSPLRFIKISDDVVVQFNLFVQIDSCLLSQFHLKAALNL